MCAAQPARRAWLVLDGFHHAGAADGGGCRAAGVTCGPEASLSWLLGDEPRLCLGSGEVRSPLISKVVVVANLTPILTLTLPLALTLTPILTLTLTLARPSLQVLRVPPQLRVLFESDTLAHLAPSDAARGAIVAARNLR